MPVAPCNLFFFLVSCFTSSLSFTLLLLSIYFRSCYSLDEQGVALLTWKNSLHSSSDPLLSWNSADSTPCGWFGIRCDTNGLVTGISLKGLALQGPLPSNLHSLPSLESLIISSANLTGSIPKEFGDYSELSFVDLSGNSLSGEIPVELCRLEKLQNLLLNTNFLEGGIPDCIGNLSSLEWLTVYDNRLGGEIPRTITALTSLQVFRAGGNKGLGGEVPQDIGNCTNLVFLGLAETGISGKLPASIGMLQRLQTLAIYTTRLSGTIPDEIGNCSELQNLYLYQNSLSGQIPKRIGQLTKLKNLFLWQNSLEGSIPDELGFCTKLKTIDLSANLLNGSIPASFGNLLMLEEFKLSVNQLSGTIPVEITNCTSLTDLEIDNNNISGEVPYNIGKLSRLTIFFAWKNNLTGYIQPSLADCLNLQALDLSNNNLSGSIPGQIFGLQNLTMLLLLSNELSGFIPPDIGNCTNLYRLRLSRNRLDGPIPTEIGKLKRLNFIDLCNNHLVSGIPLSISECTNLEFLDLHSNGINGSVPDNLPQSLQLIDISDNMLSGPLTQTIGSLTELTKLYLGRNQLSGPIPTKILSCTKLQLIDLGGNLFSGEIPKELGQIPALEIALNLSCNQFYGILPSEFSGLSKLGVLDLSHNKFQGNLDFLANLQNLVSLNVSYNEFSGELPNTPFFRNIPLSDIASNQNLYLPGGTASHSGGMGQIRSTMRVVMYILLGVGSVLVLLAIYIVVQTRLAANKMIEDGSWDITLYQKLDFSIDDIVHNLTSSNVIGTGSSGVVYRVMIPNGDEVAVKKMWSKEETGAFTSEIQTLGSIRHRNIVRLLGWASNRNLKLVFYDYLPNGSLSSLIHGARKGGSEWETRFDVVLGVAHALAYLHHDCIPPIIHGDVKAMNVLLGSSYEPYLADFGLARVMEDSVDFDDTLSKPCQSPQLAGSFGYMAPEHASAQRITEKSDVYSFGVMLLEVLTGRHPLDPTLPGGAHLVQWVRDHILDKKNPINILYPKLRERAHPTTHEMLQTLAVSFLCITTRADDRPTMKNVVAMLNEIHLVENTKGESKLLKDENLKSTPARIIVSQGSSNSSFAFSDDSVVV